MQLHLVVKAKWFDMIKSGEKKEEYRRICRHWHCRIKKHTIESVVFYRGYSDVTHERECVRVRYGFGRPEWGAPEESVIILDLGKEIEQ